MTYCFRCVECNELVESHSRYPYPTHACGGQLRRSWRDENVAPQTLQLKREREAGGRRAMRDTMLPVQKDFESPEDPDGSRGIREWADGMKPKDGNKNPLWPDMPKKVF